MKDRVSEKENRRELGGSGGDGSSYTKRRSPGVVVGCWDGRVALALGGWGRGADNYAHTTTEGAATQDDDSGADDDAHRNYNGRRQLITKRHLPLGVGSSSAPFHSLTSSSISSSIALHPPPPPLHSSSFLSSSSFIPAPSPLLLVICCPFIPLSNSSGDDGSCRSNKR